MAHRLGPADPIIDDKTKNSIAKAMTIVTVIILFLIAGWFLIPKIEESSKSQSKAPVAAAKAPEVAVEMTLSCGGDKEYLPLPSVRSIVLILNPTGEQCSTAWLLKPEKVAHLRSDPRGDIKMQVSVGAGEIMEWFDDGPLRDNSCRSNRQLCESFNAARYKNLGDDPVRILITIISGN